ncbi:MAG: phage protease [Puniceicoccales bacterium]|jgi:hypothetical protein|nr:phage protease [Puniceicoccales bacterium]
MAKDSTAAVAPGEAADANEECGGTWSKLVSYGEYPHRLGLQVVTKEAAQRMVDEFCSLSQRLANRFRGVPVYVGHPDDGQFLGLVGHGDPRPYGWVRQLEAREDGLWVRICWSVAGRELLDKARYKFLSPRWEMHPIGGERFLPKFLVSIGLTNHPNIAGDAIVQKIAPIAAPLLHWQPVGGARPAERPAWGCAPGIQFQPIAANASGLASAVLHRNAHSTQLTRGARLGTGGKKEAERRLLSLVSERMVSANETFTAAWKNVKLAHPALFSTQTFSKTAENGPSPWR